MSSDRSQALTGAAWHELHGQQSCQKLSPGKRGLHTDGLTGTLVTFEKPKLPGGLGSPLRSFHLSTLSFSSHLRSTENPQWMEMKRTAGCIRAVPILSGLHEEAEDHQGELWGWEFTISKPCLGLRHGVIGNTPCLGGVLSTICLSGWGYGTSSSAPAHRVGLKTDHSALLCSGHDKDPQGPPLPTNSPVHTHLFISVVLERKAELPPPLSPPCQPFSSRPLGLAPPSHMPHTCRHSLRPL